MRASTVAWVGGAALAGVIAWRALRPTTDDRLYKPDSGSSGAGTKTGKQLYQQVHDFFFNAGQSFPEEPGAVAGPVQGSGAIEFAPMEITASAPRTQPRTTTTSTLPALPRHATIEEACPTPRFPYTTNEEYQSWLRCRQEYV